MRAGGPRLESLDNVQYGLHYAVVCQNKDPDNLDRIKVRLPWLDGGDKDQTHWAQLMSPMEGKKFGWYTVPDKDGAGPNVCAIWKPPMSGTTGVSFSTMEGKLEITCKKGKLLMEAQQNIKINAKTTIDLKAGGDLKLEGQSATKMTSSSPSSY